MPSCSAIRFWASKMLRGKSRLEDLNIEMIIFFVDCNILRIIPHLIKIMNKCESELTSAQLSFLPHHSWDLRLLLIC